LWSFCHIMRTIFRLKYMESLDSLLNILHLSIQILSSYTNQFFLHLAKAEFLLKFLISLKVLIWWKISKTDLTNVKNEYNYSMYFIFLRNHKLLWITFPPLKMATWRFIFLTPSHYCFWAYFLKLSYTLYLLNLIFWVLFINYFLSIVVLNQRKYNSREKVVKACAFLIIEELMSATLSAYNSKSYKFRKILEIA
jgi:hypothetical protein